MKRLWNLIKIVLQAHIDAACTAAERDIAYEDYWDMQDVERDIARGDAHAG